MSNPEAYTVGWICAISTEYVAAQAFLDEEHDGSRYVSLNDNNDYTLGKIGKHNVVIAVLPDGEYGTSSAASVARDMLHSFPNVRIGLMVGIGGGAPSPKHDIRLGDIVVSAPGDGEGGVPPPTVMRTAVSGLKAQYERKGHQLENAINSIHEGNPRLRRKYKRPDPSTDKLYKSGVIHPPDSEASCAAVCDNNPSKLVLRPERTEDEDNPAIHYGLIASANQLMKDALVRDKLAAEKGVLCFEMEAAGLMNHFPCLVIRGICDYSDSHKNKEWQGYAAMVAAAYTKDLLCRIPPNKVEAENRISDLVSSIQEDVGKLLRRQHNQEHENILKWLTPIDYAPQQSDYISRRQPGTGQWLLASAEYQGWLLTSKQTLFSPGIPGAGKTILTAIVIDDLTTRFQNDPSIGIAYLYCNFRRRDEQKADDLLASLLKQISQGQSSLPDSVRALHVQHEKKRTRPLIHEISRAIQSVAAMYSGVFIVVDAVDECQVSDSCRSRFLSEIFNLQFKCRANIYATSRFIPEITEKFHGSTSLEIRASDEDVQTYLEGHISQLPSFVSCNIDLQEEIVTKIVQAADGMFLLAQLHLRSLCDKVTDKKIRRGLKNRPKGQGALDHAYQEAMERIEGQQQGFLELAKQVLSWITCARGPLTTLELQHALAVEIGESELDRKNLPETGDMVSVCAGLLTIDEENDIVRLVHYTTQEYFERTWTFWFSDAQTDITKICVTYLSFDAFEPGFCPTDKKFEERLQLNPLYDYAARNWGYHARVASLGVEQSILDLLGNEAKVSASSQALIASRFYSNDSGYSQRVPRQMTGVHLAAYFGLTGVVMALLKNRHNLDFKDTWGQTPLSWAARKGHEAAVKLLLEKGADPDLKDRGGPTPLWRAAGKGHEAAVKLLLEKGADPDSKDEDGQTALSWAAGNGHETVVQLLLEKGADPDLKDKHGQTPLWWAAEEGHETVVQLLLEKGADPDSKDDNGMTSLSRAARNGHKAVVKFADSTYV